MLGSIPLNGVVNTWLLGHQPVGSDRWYDGQTKHAFASTKRLARNHMIAAHRLSAPRYHCPNRTLKAP